MNAEFLVVGLGAFGRNVALSLAEAGQSVLAVDSSRDTVQALSPRLDAVVCADATDEAALRELGVDRVSCAVVAIGAESREASILATAILHQIGVPRIVGRAVSELHARVLRAVGAHEVISPEVEMGQRLARRLAHPNVFERIDLGALTTLAEVAVPESFAGQSLVDLGVRRKVGVTVVAIRRGAVTLASLEGSEVLASGDVLVVIGPEAAIERLADLA